MPKPRVTAADAVANVIEVVELGRRTGMLSVERGSGSVLEEGEIYFVAGRAVFAALAGLRGREALNTLSRWGACRFAFERDAPRPTPNLPTGQSPIPGSQPSQPSNVGGNGVTGPLAGFPLSRDAFWPAAGAPNTSNGQQGGMLPPDPRSYANGRGPGAPSNTTNSYPGSASSMPPTTGARGGPPQAISPLGRRPRRAPDVRDLMTVVTQYNLSRSHRTLLLLADGEHTVLDLARLSSKAVDEVADLLSELEVRGLVYYY